jgi:hypothetical protein
MRRSSHESGKAVIAAFAIWIGEAKKFVQIAYLRKWDGKRGCPGRREVKLREDQEAFPSET